MLQEARRGGYLESRLAVHAVARPDRTYHRNHDLEGGPEGGIRTIRVANPIPDLFSNRLDDDQQRDRYSTRTKFPRRTRKTAIRNRRLWVE